eukprot:798334-Rhodomonas_salina.3
MMIPWPESGERTRNLRNYPGGSTSTVNRCDLMSPSVFCTGPLPLQDSSTCGFDRSFWTKRTVLELSALTDRISHWAHTKFSH